MWITGVINLVYSDLLWPHKHFLSEVRYALVVLVRKLIRFD